MTGAAQLSAEVDVFATIIVELREVAARSDPARRSELVKLRKRLSDQIVRMRDIGAQSFADPVLANEFRSRLSTALNVVAMHQANWPAVSIDDANATYRRSALAVGESNRAFIDWTRAALARIG